MLSITPLADVGCTTPFNSSITNAASFARSIAGDNWLGEAIGIALSGGVLESFAGHTQQYITSGPICELFRAEAINLLDPDGSQALGFDYHSLRYGEIVSLQDINTGRVLYYLVWDTQDLIIEGSLIAQGCVMGLTLPVLTQQTDISTIWLKTEGFGLVWAESEIGTEFDVSNNFDIWPWSNEACSLPNFSDCLNLNPTFSDPGSGSWIWSFAGTDDRNPPGESAGLYLHSSGANDATQTIAGANTPYSIKVAGYVAVPDTDSTNTDVVFSFGDTDHTFSFPRSGSAVEFVTDLQSYTDSDYAPAAIYDLSVALDAGETGVVVITFLCVDDSADPLSDLPSCIVPNPGFDGSSDWTLTDAPPNYASIGNGSLDLPPFTQADTTISVQLRPDTYDVEIKYRALPMLVPPLAGYSASVDWAIVAADSSSLGSGYVTTDSDDFQTLDAGSFTVSSLEEPGAVFSLSGDSSTDTAQIDYVCLIPNNTPTTGTDGPSAIDCNSCPRTYIGDLLHDVPEAVDWLSCSLTQVYYCDARQIMIDTQTGVENTVRGVGMLGRWFQATFSKQAVFFKSLAFFLGGYLNNTALMIQDAFFYAGGASTYIYEDQPASLFDVLALLISGLRDVLVTALDSVVQVLSYLVPIAGMIRDIALGAFSLAESVIGAVAAQVQNIVAVFGAIIGAMNADPATIEGAPNCAADLASGSANWICWGFYILDNTIWAGPAGYMLPILVAAAALNLLIWVFEQFKDAIIDAA